jgi:hypothetical protein
VPQGIQAVVALLILLPGFVSARIARMMSARRDQSELDRIIEALIFSFFIYVFYIFCFGPKLPIEWNAVGNGSVQTFGLIPHRWRILFLTGTALVSGFTWGAVRGRDVVLKFLRWCGITERTSRESVWNDVFLTLGGTVQVGLGDGRTVIGWLKRYSDGGDERSLFLERAAWVQNDGAVIPVDGDGLLLTERSEIQFVMFLNRDANSDKTNDPRQS